MERSVQLSHSFSMPSLAEGSEPISEQDELLEVKTLKQRGDESMNIHDYTQALKHYDEALEIDDKNLEVLIARSTAYLELGDFTSALRDTETLISLEPDNAEVYKLHGVTLHNLQQSREAINALLTSLDLDPDNADETTDHIAAVVGSICNLNVDLTESFTDMDAYKKLSEVGVCLFQAQMFDLCIKILESAQKFQTNQKGITMRVLLTMANAHSAMRHGEQAISIYQECLSTAIATHEQIYQTKALVNIATLYLESGDIHQAIVYYEKLLHLESELLDEVGSEEAFPDFWTKELQCGLHLNLSIAYKTVGNMHRAVTHARKYVELLEKFGSQGRMKGESFHNAGMLNEILGNYRESLTNYDKYLKHSKQIKDKKGMAQAYGCLGSVYAALRNWKLSITYHEQYIAMAAKFKDTKMLTLANEMLADTYMIKEDYDSAIKYYEAMLQVCLRTDYRTKATALCKLGNAYREMKRSQYSIYFYEQACDLAEDYIYPDIQTLCEYNIACQHQHSTQMMDIELARKYFEKLIPYLETKIREHVSEDTHCPKEYYKQLSECYDGILCVLSKLGNKDECLQFAEMYKKRFLTEQAGYVPLVSALSVYGHPLGTDNWTVDRMNRVMSQQNAVVLYYCLLESHVLLWVLAPGTGVVRFYSGRNMEEDTSLIVQVNSILEELKMTLDWKSMQTLCENRSLPLQNLELEMTRRRNLLLTRPKSDSDKNTPERQKMNKNEDTVKAKTPSRRLFDLLIAPVEDILMKLEPESHLIIIPDKTLHHCPFGILQDWYSRYLFDRFNITYLPSLLALERVTGNELAHLRSNDDLEFERLQARKGGLRKYLTHVVPSTSTTPGDDASISTVDMTLNLRKVSNPRLVTSSQGQSVEMSKPHGLTRENTNISDEISKSQILMNSRQSTQILPGIPEYPGADTPRGTKQLPLSMLEGSTKPISPAVGMPVPNEKMLSLQSFSTLATKTSTGTDITSSSQCVTEFQQISAVDRCMVFANPQLPDSLSLHGRTWKPARLEMLAAKKEAQAVAGYMDVDAITGPEATKERFLQDCGKANILHIATYGCWKEGLLVFSPSPIQLDQGPPREQSYLVTIDDILSLKLSAQLVVLNVGYGPNRLSETITPGYRLPSAFLAAGAECVLVHAWPLPNDTVNKFYFHFYSCLQKGSLLTSACRTALKAVRKDNRYSSEYFWCPFMLIGKDVMINLNQIRHAQLDQTLDKIERDVEEETGKELLNPKSSLPKVASREECLQSLQSMLGTLLLHHVNQPTVVPELIDLLDSSLKRLHAEEINKQTTNLTQQLTRSVGGLDLLKLLGFHFQAKGATVTRPYVLYPHWNKDDLLLPTYDALRAISEISTDTVCTQAIKAMLPLTQDNVSLVIDLLSISKHATEIQLSVSDLSVKPLWSNPKIKKVLTATGFHQIGMLLNFNRTPTNKNLLSNVLQLLLAVSAHKSQVLLYRLDVNLLGKHGLAKSTAQPDVGRLPSLTPLLLPRNQLRMSTPWLSRAERSDEMDEKKKLARSKSDLDEQYSDYLERAKTWHQITVVAQANEALSKFGRPKTSPTKVKVLPGSTASRERIPVNREPLMMIPEVDQRRDYAQYVLQQRISNIDLRRKNEVMKLYLPYIQST